MNPVEGFTGKGEREILHKNSILHQFQTFPTQTGMTNWTSHTVKAKIQHKKHDFCLFQKHPMPTEMTSHKSFMKQQQ